jgi:hypothetical protein
LVFHKSSLNDGDSSMNTFLKAGILLLICSSCANRYRPPANENYQTAYKIYEDKSRKLAQLGICIDPNFRQYQTPQPYLCADYATTRYYIQHVEEARKLYMKIYMDFAESLKTDPLAVAYLHDKPINGDVLNVTIRFYDRNDSETRHHYIPAIACVDIDEDTINYKIWEHLKNEYKILHSETIDEALRHLQNAKPNLTPIMKTNLKNSI